MENINTKQRGVENAAKGRHSSPWDLSPGDHCAGAGMAPTACRGPACSRWDEGTATTAAEITGRGFYRTPQEQESEWIKGREKR